jgi:hypothetical protein
MRIVNGKQYFGILTPKVLWVFSIKRASKQLLLKIR